MKFFLIPYGEWGLGGCLPTIIKPLRGRGWRVQYWILPTIIEPLRGSGIPKILLPVGHGLLLNSIPKMIFYLVEVKEKFAL